MSRKILMAWERLCEGLLLAGCLTVALVFGVTISWIVDDKPLFIESPDRTMSYVENSQVKAGDYAIVVRSLIRTSSCPIQSGIFIVKMGGGILYPITSFVSVAPRSTAYVKSRVAYLIPKQVPPGYYGIRQYASCQRNPIVEIGQALSDLPFEVMSQGGAK